MYSDKFLVILKGDTSGMHVTGTLHAEISLSNTLHIPVVMRTPSLNEYVASDRHCTPMTCIDVHLRLDEVTLVHQRDELHNGIIVRRVCGTYVKKSTAKDEQETVCMPALLCLAWVLAATEYTKKLERVSSNFYN